jgi:hypothetical protein
MEKELHVKMSFYLKLHDGETKEEAQNRFYSIMDKLQEMEEQESSMQVYEIEEQDY